MKLLTTLALALALACGASDYTPTQASAVVSNTPITELTGSYFGFTGGLYGNGSNVEPQAHVDSAFAAAARIVPRDLNGNPGSGKYVLASVGFSNAAQEFCAKVTITSNPACTSNSFVGQAKTDTETMREVFRIYNGAIGGQANEAWDSPSDQAYDLVQTRLASANLSYKQVQAEWLKIANKQPTVSLPDSNADVYSLMASTGNIIRAMKVRYPNLQMVFISPRIYAGYSKTTLNPEPFAYEGAFAVQAVVNAQIHQYETGEIDPIVGDLGSSVAPWVGWGPYMWADGMNPRLDGLIWKASDFATDGTHPSTNGVTKVGGMLVSFFKTTPYAACWYVKGQHC